VARARHTPSFLVFMTSGGLFTVRSFLHAAVLPLFLPLSVWMEISLSLRSHRPMSRLLAPSLPVALFTGLSRLKIPAISSAYFCSAVVHRAEKAGESPQEGKVSFLEDLTLTKTRRCCTDWSYLEDRWASAALAGGRSPGCCCGVWTGKARNEDIGPFCTLL